VQVGRRGDARKLRDLGEALDRRLVRQEARQLDADRLVGEVLRRILLQLAGRLALAVLDSLPKTGVLTFSTWKLECSTSTGRSVETLSRSPRFMRRPVK
jgi:hypothetical protein